MCKCEICGQPFPNHTALSEHIFSAHGNSRVNWNSRFVAAFLAVVVAVSLLLPAKAQDSQPPSVGEPPTIAVEHRVFLPFVVAPEDGPEGQGRYWGGVAQYVSWCPSCSPRR